MSDAIDLFAGLRGISGSVSVSAPQVEIVLDDDAIASLIAGAAADDIRSNMLRGTAPDGSSLPPVAASTVKRRGPGPRGQRTGRLVRSIASRATPGGYVVAADEIEPGQMAHTLGPTVEWQISPSSPAYRAALARAAQGLVRTKK